MSKTRAKPDSARAQLQLKVSLLDIQPAIWRRLLVPSGIKLPTFDAVLQSAFGWTNSHMHAFRLEEDSYEVVHPGDWPADFSGPGRRFDEKKFRLCDLLHAKDDWLIYEYDFGDSWEHEVRVEKVVGVAGPRAVVCLDGARAGPPEDCGGVPGYENLVAAMADPKHPGRQDLLEWLGEPFDPEAFSLDAINRRLKGIKV
jgi:hypothetical protein